MKTPKKRRSKRSGFTFIEVMVAVTLLVVGFMGMILSLHASAQLRETANETNVAMFKLQNVVEYLRSIPYDDTTTVLPKDTAIDIVALTDSATENDFTLSNEAIEIAYEDEDTDFMKFMVTIRWNTRTGTQRWESLSSARAR